MNNSINVGDIYVSQGGYDANFAFFYKVMRVTTKSAVLKSIGQKNVSAGTSCMDYGHVVADPSTDGRRGVKTCRIQGDSENPYFKVDSSFCAYARKWDGRPIHTYNYH